MKIIGGHDYYDGAGLGVDESIVFVRKPEEHHETPLSLPGAIGRRDAREPGLRFFHVLLGGEVYPGVREVRASYKARKPNGDLEWVVPEDRLHYDEDAALAALKEFEEKNTQSWVLSRTQPRDRIARHFGRSCPQSWTDWMVENRAITGLVRRESKWVGRGWITDHIAEINISTLKELEFYRVVDPATAHMRIANFIGGVLPHGTETVEISNDSKIRKAGFDTRSSFRTPKGTKKPRRA